MKILGLNDFEYILLTRNDIHCEICGSKTLEKIKTYTIFARGNLKKERIGMLAETNLCSDCVGNLPKEFKEIITNRPEPHAPILLRILKEGEIETLLKIGFERKFVES